MTYSDFISELRKAKISVREFADLIGMNPNSISNYARSGEVPTHLAVIIVLIAEMVRKNIDYQILIENLKLSPKKPRGAGKAGCFGGNHQSHPELDLFMEDTND
ncbi:TPA: helix-turn-helix domain-containing protein [Acinetobacter baumannii]|uniref:helix-turn-helix domain-containing protein n=1 Tax=Acinetobacter soli TaxID=487316 RepID=UPI001ABD0B4C|nr:helix-turn-helix transcriptional regulator [Acinetobacter soli]MBO3639840.1 helix-turn-helix transcriptional regulator [Acinetobacter soli]